MTFRRLVVGSFIFLYGWTCWLTLRIRALEQRVTMLEWRMAARFKK